jgi:hypothetical protein
MTTFQYRTQEISRNFFVLFPEANNLLSFLIDESKEMDFNKPIIHNRGEQRNNSDSEYLFIRYYPFSCLISLLFIKLS